MPGTKYANTPTVVYSSRDSCCDDVTWARPHRLFFNDDNRVFTVDLARRRATLVAAFSDFYASPDGVWIAGYDFVPPGEPQFAALVRVATRKCVLFPGRRNYIGGKFQRAATGFSSKGRYVVVWKPHVGTVRYRIARLNDACPAE